MLQIQNVSDYKWCCYYWCNQVCSDKQGETSIGLLLLLEPQPLLYFSEKDLSVTRNRRLDR